MSTIRCDASGCNTDKSGKSFTSAIIAADGGAAAIVQGNRCPGCQTVHELVGLLD
jgi:hypothetical protein